MNKLGIFVEGQTELLFVEKLLNSIANRNQLSMELYGASGGKNAPFRMTLIRRQGSNNARHYIQIVDCSSDGNVKPYIKERYGNLTRENFWAAIGIRDVFPKVLYPQVASLRAGLAYGIPTRPVDVIFILGIMEIESWFIAEHSHFQKLSPLLTVGTIASTIGCDPAMANLELIPNPADALDRIYKIAGMRYTKTQSNCLRTIDNLDYAEIYLQLRTRFLDLQTFMSKIDAFLALP